MNTIDVYKEEDLLKTINGKFIVEAYKHKITQNKVIGLCTNSFPMFCRKQDNVPDSDCSWMEILTSNPSILKHDNIEEEYNTRCPKIAWGIAAYLLFHSYTDTKGRTLFKINQDAVQPSDLFRYYNEQNKKHYTTLNKEDFDYYKSIGDTTSFDKEFIEHHIAQEESLINRQNTSIPDCIKEKAKEYIEWIKSNRNDKEIDNAHVNTTKYPSELLDLFNGHEELINKLIGKSDDEKAQLIREWNKGKDGKPLIKNFKDRLRKEYATQLKKAGLISESIENFRKKLS